MKNFFQPEDFKNIYKQVMKQGYRSNGAGDMWEPDYRPEDIAIEVNEKLNALIEQAPMVYCRSSGIKEPDWTASERRAPGDTHKAKLMFIEQLVKEECVHEPQAVGLFDNYDDLKKPFYAYKNLCKHCGVELEASWTEKKI